MPNLVEGLDAHVTSGALGHHQGPDRFDVPVPGLGCSAGPTGLGGPGRLDGIGGVGLAPGPPGLAVLTVDLHDVNAVPAEIPGEAGAVGAGALHPDQGDGSEGAHPNEQLPVAGRRRGKRLHAKKPTKRIEGRRHVDIQVGVDSTRDRTRSFYDGHAIPSFLMVKGWHARPGTEQRC